MSLLIFDLDCTYTIFMMGNVPEMLPLRLLSFSGLVPRRLSAVTEEDGLLCVSVRGAIVWVQSEEKALFVRWIDAAAAPPRTPCTHACGNGWLLCTNAARGFVQFEWLSGYARARSYQHVEER